MKRQKLTLAQETQIALAVAWKVPGLFGRHEAAFLYRLARRRGKLVELGCWMGRSTSILLQAAAVWGATLTTVDAFTPMPNGRDASTPERWRANLRKVGLKPPELLAMTSDEAAKVYPNDQDIALLFIDADHSEAAVRRDLANWTPRVKVDGVVALHDLWYHSIPGVARAITDWWCSEWDERGAKWHPLGQHDYTVAFRRLR